MKQLLRAALVPPFDPTLAARERILREGFFSAARGNAGCLPRRLMGSEGIVIDLAEQRRRRVAG